MAIQISTIHMGDQMWQEYKGPGLTTIHLVIGQRALETKRNPIKQFK